MELFSLAAGAPAAGFSQIDSLVPFLGTRSLHMTSHTCSGLPIPANRAADNRTCAFSNLYFRRRASSDGQLSVWYYFLAASTEELAAPNWNSAVVLARLRDELRLELLTVTHYPASLWPIEFVLFHAVPAPSPAAAHASLMRPLPPPRRSNNRYPSWLPPEAVSQPASQCRLVPRGGASGGEDSGAAGPGGIACVPPGVGRFSSRPFFFLWRGVLWNLGHTVWDESVSFVAAMDDLGLTEQRANYDLLMIGPNLLPEAVTWRWPRFPASPPPWGGDMGCRELYSYLSPRGEPAEYLDLMDEAAPNEFVLFEHFAGGLSGMSPHNLRRTMRVHGAERRSVWRMREHVMRNMGFSDAEIGATARAVALPPLPNSTLPRYRVVLVKGKRALANSDALRGAIAAAFPRFEVVELSWGSLGGLKGEIDYLAHTHMTISVDGTAALNVPFLPQGAVHVNLGLAKPWGSFTQCEFLYSGLDHVRALFYRDLAPGEHSGSQYEPMTVPFHKLQPLLTEAQRLLDDGFDVPTAELANMTPNAQLLRFLHLRYPEFAEVADLGWREQSHVIQSAPAFWAAPIVYRRFVGPVPKAFYDDIAAFCAAQDCGLPRHGGNSVLPATNIVA